MSGQLWGIVTEIADALCVARDSRVLDCGCGDGAFANRVLAVRYRAIEGLDKSENAIRRAQADASYRAADLVTFDYDSLPHYDAALLIGILHHVKSETPALVRALARRTGKMIVLAPNGNHLMRKTMELTPSYRAAGEVSFRSKDLTKIFAAAGWQTVIGDGSLAQNYLDVVFIGRGEYYRLVCGDLSPDALDGLRGPRQSHQRLPATLLQRARNSSALQRHAVAPQHPRFRLPG